MDTNQFGLPSISDTFKQQEQSMQRIDMLNSNYDRLDDIGSSADIEKKFNSKIMQEDFKRPHGTDMNYIERLYIDNPLLKFVM